LQASAALGLLEPHEGAALNIPRSWRRGGVGAYYRLRGRQLHSLVDLWSLLDPPQDIEWSSSSRPPEQGEEQQLWAVPPGNKFPFLCKYMVRMTPAE